MHPRLRKILDPPLYVIYSGKRDQPIVAPLKPLKSIHSNKLLEKLLEDVSINNEYEYENDFKPYSYSKSFSQLSMLAMTPSSSYRN